MSQSQPITQLFAVLSRSPFYKKFAYRTLSGAIDRYAACRGNSLRTIAALDATSYAFENDKPIPPEHENDFVRIIEAAAPPGSPIAENIDCLKKAAERFTAHPSIRVSGEIPHPHMRARGLINRLKHGKEVNLRRLQRCMNRLEPHTSECYDLASRLIFLLSLITHGDLILAGERPFRPRVIERHILEALRTLVHKKLQTGAPEVYALASSRMLSGLIEDEFPGFSQIVTLGEQSEVLIDPGLIRDARNQGAAYMELSLRFDYDSDSFLEEASWLHNNLVSYFEGKIRYFYIKHSAMDAFMAIAPRLTRSDRGKALLDKAMKKLAAFVSEEWTPGMAYHRGDMDRAEREFAVLLALQRETGTSGDSALV